MYCKYCGREVREDMNYCPSCGEVLCSGSKMSNFLSKARDIGGIDMIEHYQDNESIFENVHTTVRESDKEAWTYEIERAYEKYKDVKLKRWLGILICVACAVIPLNATFCLSLACFMLYDFGVTASKKRAYYGFMLMRALVFFEVLWIVGLIFDLSLGMRGIF